MSVLETLLMIDLVSIGATLRWLYIRDSITIFDYTTLFVVSLMFKQITNHFHFSTWFAVIVRPRAENLGSTSPH